MAKIVSFLAAWLLLLAGCIREQSVLTADVDPLSWGADRPARVVFTNADTLRTIDLGVAVRYDRQAGGSTLSLRIATLTPDSLSITEELEMPLPATDKGGCREAAMLYRGGVVFSRAGEYRFEISPRGSVEGVHAVGVELRNNGQR